jgi:hypothetical protein
LYNGEVQGVSEFVRREGSRQEMKTCFGPAGSLLLALALSLCGCFGEDPTLKSITITSPERLQVDRTIRLRAAGLYSDGKERTYGIAWSSSDTGIATINDKGYITTVKPGGVIVRAEKDGIASERPLIVEPAFDGLKIHYKRPPEWREPNAYIFQEFGANMEQYSGEWPGARMAPEGNGWYVFAVEGIPMSKVIFNDGNLQDPRPQAPGFELKKGEWWYDGKWHETDPVWEE